MYRVYPRECQDVVIKGEWSRSIINSDEINLQDFVGLAPRPPAQRQNFFLRLQTTLTHEHLRSKKLAFYSKYVLLICNASLVDKRWLGY